MPKNPSEIRQGSLKITKIFENGHDRIAFGPDQPGIRPGFWPKSGRVQNVRNLRNLKSQKGACCHLFTHRTQNLANFRGFKQSNSKIDSVPALQIHSIKGTGTAARPPALRGISVPPRPGLRGGCARPRPPDPRPQHCMGGQGG